MAGRTSAVVAGSQQKHKKSMKAGGVGVEVEEVSDGPDLVVGDGDGESVELGSKAVPVGGQCLSLDDESELANPDAPMVPNRSRKRKPKKSVS